MPYAIINICSFGDYELVKLYPCINLLIGTKVPKFDINRMLVILHAGNIQDIILLNFYLQTELLLLLPFLGKKIKVVIHDSHHVWIT